LPKIGCHGNVSKGIKKEVRIEKIDAFREKIVKIGPVDSRVICLKLKKEETTEGKIHSPLGKFAERAK